MEKVVGKNAECSKVELQSSERSSSGVVNATRSDIFRHKNWIQKDSELCLEMIEAMLELDWVVRTEKWLNERGDDLEGDDSRVIVEKLML
jgi:hypothetical protein